MGRHIDKWNKIENPEIGPHEYAQVIFNKGAQEIQYRLKDRIFSKYG